MTWIGKQGTNRSCAVLGAATRVPISGLTPFRSKRSFAAAVGPPTRIPSCGLIPSRLVTGGLVWISALCWLPRLAVAAAGFGLSGTYTLSNHDLATGAVKAEYPSDFTFARIGDDWKLEVTCNLLTPGFDRLQWVWADGVMYRTEFAASQATNVLPRIMAITTNHLPAFGWHCAIPLLLAFAPDLVLETNPPAIPREAFATREKGQPERLWCELGGVGAGYPFLEVRAYAERSFGVPAPSVPARPKDPFLVFECKVLDPVQVGGHRVPTRFSFRACYPRAGGSLPEDVTTMWDVDGKVDPTSLRPATVPLLKLEGRTLVADYRAPMPDGRSVQYLATNSLLAINSPHFAEFRKALIDADEDRAASKTKAKIIVVFMLLASVPIFPFLLRRVSGKHRESLSVKPSKY
jgi:hypothetical protein